MHNSGSKQRKRNTIPRRQDSSSSNTCLVGRLMRLIGMTAWKVYLYCALQPIRHPEYSSVVTEEDWLRGLIQIATVFNMTDPENVEQGSLGCYHPVRCK